jgi:hypothetical protein
MCYDYSEMLDLPVLSLESANALVPRLNLVVGEQIGRRCIIELKLAALTALLGSMPDALDPVDADTEEVARLRAETREMIGDYRKTWQEVEALGAVVKDPQKGLVDFYGQMDGQLVWLCWQYGEAEVSHYHGIAEGFSNRKVIEGAIKQRLLN